MPELTRVERVRGCLLGLAVGDALGAPLEGLSPQQIRSHYGVVNNFVDGQRAWKKKPFRWRMPGLYSDDTQQALALCDVLRARGRVEPEALADLYVRMATPRGAYAGSHRGIGRSFRQVLQVLEAGGAPAEAGQGSAGIGAAMRIAPLGLFYDQTAEGLLGPVMAASLMTHRDIRSLAGAVAVACGVRRLALGEAREPSWLFKLAGDVHAAELRIAAEYRDAVTSVPCHQHAMSTAIARVECVLDLSRERAFAALVEEANRHGSDPACRRATMGFPPALIPTCLYILLTSDTLDDALIEVVNLGGDADSAGAILGALAGASHGIGAIPRRWLDGLANRDGIDARAVALAGRRDDPSIPDLVETERVLSVREDACRDALRATLQNGDDLGANRRR